MAPVSSAVIAAARAHGHFDADCHRRAWAQAIKVWERFRTALEVWEGGRPGLPNFNVWKALGRLRCFAAILGQWLTPMDVHRADCLVSRSCMSHRLPSDYIPYASSCIYCMHSICMLIIACTVPLQPCSLSKEITILADLRMPPASL